MIYVYLALLAYCFRIRPNSFYLRKIFIILNMMKFDTMLFKEKNARVTRLYYKFDEIQKQI